MVEESVPFDRETLIGPAAVYGGVVFFLPKPATTVEMLDAARKLVPELVVEVDDCGFLTSEGRFVSRELAKVVAITGGHFEGRQVPLGAITTADLWG